MIITKAIAIHAMALSLQGGHDVGWGASAAAAAVLEGEDWKGAAVEADENLLLPGENAVRLASRLKAEEHQDKPSALRAFSELLDSLGVFVRDGLVEDAVATKGLVSEDGGAAKLRGAIAEGGHVEDSAGLVVSDADVEFEEAGGGEEFKDHEVMEATSTSVLLAEYERAKDEYAHTMAESSFIKMRDDYAASDLSGDPDVDLPTFEEVKGIFMKMYESFHPRPESELEEVIDDNSNPDGVPPSSWVNITWDNETHIIDNATISFNDTDAMHNYTWTNYTSQFNTTAANSTKGVDMTNYTEDEALLFINGRMTAESWSSTFQEVMVCKDMFTAEDHGLNITDEEFMNLTLSDMDLVAQACYSERVSTSLEALGYNTETFCPLLETILPLQFQVLGEVITQNVTSFCSFLVDTTFESAGEPECYRRMEEVVLTDTIRQGSRYSFPNIVNTSTFDNSYIDVCTSNREPFYYDIANCTDSLAAVKTTSIDFMPGNGTMISYLSNLCDAFGLPVPHPNETIRARFLDQHVHHKPGGKPNIKIRHMMSDLFNYVGHYKHGFKNKYGHDIEHPTDTLLDPDFDDLLSTESKSWNCDENARQLTKSSPKMTCDQRNLYCSGLAFSVGAGVDVSAGPMSIGGGVDFGFGIADDAGEYYEETFVWGICGSVSLPMKEVDNAKAESKKSNTRKKMESKDVGVSVGISAGGWTNTGHIPGFAETLSITITILVVDVGFTIIETFADAWMTSNGPHGFLLEVGGSFPPNGPLSVDLDQAKCYGATIESAAGANPSFPRRYQIDTNARWTKELCGPNTYSLNIENTGKSHSDTSTGLSLYYYANEADWNAQKNQKWIVHYCGAIDSGKITTMGHGDHFTTSQVYGVGIAAHGDDAYNLGKASLFQTVGGNKWVQQFVADDLDICVSTNDNGCYPNVEIRIKGDGMPKFGKGNNEIEWRSGNMRVPTSNHCVQKINLDLGTYTQDFPRKDWENNYNCGGKMTMTFNPYGSSNSDKIYNIDEKAACEACRDNLKANGYIDSGSCVSRGINEWKVNYEPKKTYNSVRKCNPETCSAGYVYCKGEHNRSLKVYIRRDGKSHQDRLYDIPWNWSWETNADKCCSWLKSNGYVSSCSKKHVTSGMDLKYVGTRSCSQHCWYESELSGCGLQYDIGCGGDMTLQRYERCQSSGEDTVSKLWEGGCDECGKNLVARGKIKSGYKCESAGVGGMYLKYDPIEVYDPKSTPVTMLFDSGSGRHGNDIESLKDGFSWEGGCEHAKNELIKRGYIKNPPYSYYGNGFYDWLQNRPYCDKNALKIWLNYSPKDDWYPMSGNIGGNELDMGKDCALVKVSIDFNNNHGSSGTTNDICITFPGQSEHCEVPGSTEKSDWPLTTEYNRLCKEQSFTITNKGGDAFLADQFKVIGKDNKFTAYIGGDNNVGWCLSQDYGDWTYFGNAAVQYKCCKEIKITAVLINDSSASLNWAWGEC